MNESFRLNKNFSIFGHTMRIKEIISLHDCDPRSRFLLFTRDVKNDKEGRETCENKAACVLTDDHSPRSNHQEMARVS